MEHWAGPFTGAIPLFDSNGEVAEWFGTATDVTERRKAEEALRELADTLENQVRARTQDLEEQTVELVKQSEYIRNLSARMVKIQDEERRRIARELHDSAGQTLTALGLNLAELIERAGKIARSWRPKGERSKRRFSNCIERYVPRRICCILPFWMKLD